ncbi:terpenoid synthase [Aspergillus egyptiacus]|nr:terpenoid synthase [Aspergillus egyptiacus]
MEKQEYTSILQVFLRDISYHTPHHEYDFALEHDVYEYFVSLGFAPGLLVRLKPIARWSTGIAVTTYPWLSRSIQRVIAIYTVYLIAIDDLAPEMKNDLKGFSQRLYRTQQPENQLLRCFLGFMDVDVCSLYGQFSRDMMLKANIDFVAACYLEVELEASRGISLPREALSFPYYLRQKSGIAEVYALLAFPAELYPEDLYLTRFLPAIPDLVYVFNVVNDIMSFYKESIVGTEKANLVSHIATVKSLSALRSLQHLCQETSEAIERIRAILSAVPQMQQDIENIFHGYTLYHLSQSRYRLKELGIPEAFEAEHLVKENFLRNKCDKGEPMEVHVQKVPQVMV